MKRHLSWNEDNGKKDSNNQGPPNLDELFNKVQQQLKDIFGNKGGGNNNGFKANKPSGTGGNSGAGFITGFVILIILILIGFLGFFKVDPGEQAAVFRFGKYIQTEGPGPHWIMLVLYSKEIVNTSAVKQMKFEDEMITKEVNIILISLVVQYKVANITDYLFNVENPLESLSQSAQSAIRQAIADSSLNEVLTTVGTANVFLGEKIKELLVKNLALYKTGLEVRGVEILSVQPPHSVKEAFNDAIQAQEDEIKYQNQAEAYAKKVIPVAQGKSFRIIQDSNAYAVKTVLDAEGDVAKFNAVLPEYTKAPDVFKSRVYLSVMQNSLVQNPFILIDSKSANNILYIPWDKLQQNLNLDNNNTQKILSSLDNKTNSMDTSGSTKINNDAETQVPNNTRYGKYNHASNNSWKYNRNWER